MVTVECPWCEAQVALQAADLLRCDDCRIEVEISAEVATEVALAA